MLVRRITRSGATVADTASPVTMNISLWVKRMIASIEISAKRQFQEMTVQVHNASLAAQW
ncbi:MAG: hypothetical protein ACLFRT_08180 [Actinomycetota bacterium]